MAASEGASVKSIVALGLLDVLTRRVRSSRGVPARDGVPGVRRGGGVAARASGDPPGSRRRTRPDICRGPCRSGGRKSRYRQPLYRSRPPLRRGRDPGQRLHGCVEPRRTGLQRTGGRGPRLTRRAGRLRARPSPGGGRDDRRGRARRTHRRPRPADRGHRQPGRCRVGRGRPRGSCGVRRPAGGGDPRGSAAGRADGRVPAVGLRGSRSSGAIRTGWIGSRWASSSPRCRSRTC